MLEGLSWTESFGFRCLDRVRPGSRKQTSVIKNLNVVTKNSWLNLLPPMLVLIEVEMLKTMLTNLKKIIDLQMPSLLGMLNLRLCLKTISTLGRAMVSLRCSF